MHLIAINKPTMSSTGAASEKAARATEEKSKVKGDETTSSTRSDDRSTAAATIKHDEVTQTDQSNAKRSILSAEAKQRAQVLLERLTREIDNRIKISNAIYPHTHTVYPASEHYKDSSRFSQSSNKSSNDPFTTERPPKSHRRSSEQRKTSPQDESAGANNSWPSWTFSSAV